jgi:hypothetical protein
VKTVAVVADNLMTLASRLTDVATAHPGAQVTRSQVGNLSILDADRRYIGWADVLTGEVNMIAGEEPS